MMRITTIILCFLVAASAAGRYRAETAVREARVELNKLDLQQSDEVRAIQMLRAEVAYLENPERLAKLARAKTDLRPTMRDQALSSQEFAFAMGTEKFDVLRDETIPLETIANAIAMVQLADGE